jgi:glutathione S-transferase
VRRFLCLAGGGSWSSHDPAATIVERRMRLYDYDASGNCFKVRLLLALLDVDYERVPIDIFAGETLTPEFARLNPLRETPVLETDDGSVLAQSNAIVWFLGEGTRYMPQTAYERGEVVQWLFFEQERVMSGIGSARFRIMTGRGPDVVPARLALGQTALETLEARLESRRFLVGDRCSIADISNYAYTHVAPDAGYDLGAYPAVERWLALVEAEPGFVDDLVPYPDNAREGLSRSIYDG